MHYECLSNAPSLKVIIWHAFPFFHIISFNFFFFFAYVRLEQSQEGNYCFFLLSPTSCLNINLCLDLFKRCWNYTVYPFRTRRNMASHTEYCKIAFFHEHRWKSAQSPRLHERYSNNRSLVHVMAWIFFNRSIHRGTWKGSLTESHWLKVAYWESIHWNGEKVQQVLFHQSNMHYNISYKRELGHSCEKKLLIEAGTDVAKIRWHLLSLKLQIWSAENML